MNGLHILRNPAGTFHFVGRVPAELAYDSTNEEDLRTAQLCGPGLARKIAERNGRTFRTLTWPTEAAARAYAEARGYTPSKES